ncbi:putative ATP-dependent RNA helicase SoYb [Drosophila gunungcola]|uniref:putative ATP-dependent RNA helicase SoYb n=1 Tax=Drosophila gunungcola TaxID=103775 RepID=UPI0022E4439C|nr:putative ATP-dependent RNA helicase SoYb [Drosophila gunungcola]XP_052853335.1 putative ATP-dependent RNA helicase SoYb [Drosophila gunungcola]XP_052853336.1 putative ATP-dependent RNA helicase SoYb [Drosophila gunungcola]XP_052853338.1 putative ATP-dependent RNA helicase SoYb [Drosophila gunungcola]XP_052853339.1 putative ATP-dependent RNA helicase SoYb [Drosophila gunungcola]
MMCDGSNSSPCPSKARDQLDMDLGESILITHYVSPQQFSYVRCKDVLASASSLRQIECDLADYCTRKLPKHVYQNFQPVIVRYLAWNPPKLLRGVVRRRLEADQYLIWLQDYGFTLSCPVDELWPLPDHLSRRFWDIKWGGVAFITPHDGSAWSQSAIRSFDKQLEEAIQLTFQVLYRSSTNRDFGQLMIRSNSHSESFKDAANFLIEREHALYDDTILLMDTPSYDDLSLELAEINYLGLEARPRVKGIFELVAGSQSSENSMKLQPVVVLQKPINTDLSFVNCKTLEKKESSFVALKEARRNLTRPETQHQKLDGLLQSRNPLLIPETSKVLSKIQSIRDCSVETALNSRPTNNNQEALTSDKINLFEKSRKLESRHKDIDNLSDCLPKLQLSPIKQTATQLNPIVVKDTASSASCGSLENLGESLTLSNSERLPPVILPKPKFVPTSVMLKLSAPPLAKALPAFANGNGPDPLNSRSVSFCMNKMERIFNDMLGKKNDNRITNSIPPTLVRNSGKKLIPVVGNKDINVASSVLAHSHVSVDPVTSFKEIPLRKEIQMAMNNLNFHTPLVTQGYAWPHLVQGGSLILVDGSRAGRSWSYLPIICSSVLRSMQDTPPNCLERVACGPLTILVVDSVDNANKLVSHCDFLMRDYDTQHLKVVNTHAHGMTDVHLMLLNSCGVLVTTPAHLLDILNVDGLTLLDPVRLEYLIFDDFDRMRLGNSQLLDEVLQKINGMGCQAMQLVVVAQQWNTEKFKKLLKRAIKPLIVFGDFFAAAMYGGLKLKFILRNSALKQQQLLDILQEQKAPRKRTLIYCNSQELDDLKIALTGAGHTCVGISKAMHQEPHELLLISDSQLQEQLPARNIELLIHFSLPESWSKFAYRFHTMADIIRNVLKTPLENVQPLISFLLLDEGNSREWPRTIKFLEDHGVDTKELMSQFMCTTQQKSVDSLLYCPYLLSSGECNQSLCDKRHHHVNADFPYPGNPLQQSGTVIRCKLHKAYTAAHMAVLPIKYKCKGSPSWMDVPYPSNPSTLMLKMSLRVPQKIHTPYYLNDVCFVLYHGHLRRVRIVDIPSRRPVTVQFMDHGTELVQIKPSELLECPEKFRTQPPLAMDIRLSGVVAAGEEGKWSSDSIRYVDESFGPIDGQVMQITVDFAVLDVVYVREIALIEECRTMQTSVYKIFLRKELFRRGFARLDSKVIDALRTMSEDRKEEIEKLIANKENIGYFNVITDLEDPEKDLPSAPISEVNIFNGASQNADITMPLQEKMMTAVDQYINDKVSVKTTEKKNIVEEKDSLKTLEDGEKAVKENQAQVDSSLDSSTAFLNALTYELNTNSPSKKQHTQKFLHSIVNEQENHEIIPFKISCAKALNSNKSAQAGPKDPSKDQVSQSLQCGTKAGESVYPRVKWHQTHTYIELVIEQQASDYNLIVQGNVLKYSVTTTSPPQRCVLNLLGEVGIETQKQLGYYLHVKLTKVDLLVYWPTLLNSLYTQQQSQWLIYDTERAQGPPPSEGLGFWEGYLSKEISNNNSNPDEYEFSSSSEDISQPGVEYCDLDSALYEDI